MSEEARQTGIVFDYDEGKKYGFVRYDEDKDPVYLSPEEADGKDLEEGSEITFIIRVKGTRPCAVDVKLK